MPETIIDENKPAPTDLGDGSPPGHIDKMLGNKVEPKEGEEGYVAPVVPARPDNVPEKFWDAEKGVVNTEALLKSQADAEAALRKVDPKVEPKEGEEGYVKPGDTPAQGKVVAAASTEFAEKGELTAETYTALEAAGLSKEMVDNYIAGQKSIVSTLQDAAYSPFTDKDGYERAANWAAEHVDEAGIKALDVQLTSNNPAIVAQGAKALAAKYVAEADIEPNTIRGNANNAAAGDSYASSREMMKDMNSKEYKTSAAFRQMVSDKIGRSPNL